MIYLIKNRIKLVCIVSIAFVCFSNIVFAKSLPVYKEILQEVKFWEDAFSKYKSDQCIYHDPEHLNIVYSVDYIWSPNKRKKAKNIDSYRNKVKSALKKFAKGKKPSNSYERKVYSSIPKHMRKSADLNILSRRVRCQTGINDSFVKALRNSKKYLSSIKKETKRLGLPDDLAYLPHLESAFNNKAKSKVGARGVWQLMPSTARLGGLTVNSRKDDRLNVSKSTKVALKKIQSYYSKTKSWGLTLTAYNYGINGTLRAIKKYNTRHYPYIRKHHKTPIFGFASKNFYPSFIAVRNAAKKYEADSRKYRSKRAEKSVSKKNRKKG